MKRNTIYCLVIFLAGAIAPACERTLEKEPLERNTDEYLWDPQDSLGTYARRFLSSIYSLIPDAGNRIGGPGGRTGDILDATSDDAMSSESGSLSDQVAAGGYTPLFNPDNAWGNNYVGIRKANMFLNNFDVVPLKDKVSKRAWKAEARFLRAMFYFELLKRYGGIPLMGDEVRELNDDLEIPRNSYADCVQYIVDECEAIKDSLRSDPIDDINIGRPTKAAALALKARILLYAASPLFNGGNIASGPEGEVTGYASYDQERWKLAADAAKELIDLNVYGLEDDLLNIFTNLTNNEVIFSRQSGLGTNYEVVNAPVGYATAGTGAGGSGRTSPTQELVETFGMSNGLPITDPLSGYDPSDPYFGRDPRFYASIFHNGSIWLNRPVETYDGGRDRPGGIVTQTRTGYYMRKFMGRYEMEQNYDNKPQNACLFRYAEVLLNYAEALNEFQGASPEVYEALESIRERAGLDPYQLPPGLKKEEMRKVIWNERRVELAFEEHRYWDIRRWKIAEEVYSTPQHGMRIIVNRGTGSLFYEKEPVRTPVFHTPRMYFYPIPYNELVKNGNMIQNPGW